jgi:hypothetical protein
MEGGRELGHLRLRCVKPRLNPVRPGEHALSSTLHRAPDGSFRIWRLEPASVHGPCPECP